MGIRCVADGQYQVLENVLEFVMHFQQYWMRFVQNNKMENIIFVF